MSNFSASQITATNVIASNIACETMNVALNPTIGQTLIGTLPASYYNNPFPTSVILLVDQNNNYIPLPTASNCYNTRTFCYVNNLGPGAGGAWGGTNIAYISFGTSPIMTPTLSLNLIGAQVSAPLGAASPPYNAPIPVNLATGFATGINNFTGCLNQGSIGAGVTFGIGALQVVTTATSPNNYLAIQFSSATLTPGTNNAVGKLVFYMSYVQF